MPTAINPERAYIFRVKNENQGILQVIFRGSSALKIRTLLNLELQEVVRTDPIPLYEWTQVELSQNEQPDGLFDFTVLIDGKEIYRQVNHQLKVYENVRLIVSQVEPGPFARLRNVRHKTSSLIIIGKFSHTTVSSRWGDTIKSANSLIGANYYSLVCH